MQIYNYFEMKCPAFFYCFILFILAIHNVKGYRNISFELNPQCAEQEVQGCEDNALLDCDTPWLVYGSGLSVNNSVHYLWGFKEYPSFVMITADVDSKITIDWCAFQKYQPNVINFSNNVRNVFGISFQNLILFNDVNDTGRIDTIPSENWVNTSLSSFTWNAGNVTDFTDKWTTSFETSQFNKEDLVNDTKIVFSVSSFTDNGRADVVPHLITTPESSQLDIILNNLLLDFNDKPLNGFESPRYALDMVLISNDGSKDNFMYDSHKSLDDEYTPGVFDLISVTTPNGRLSTATCDSGAYLQWRPVCYLDNEDNINLSTYPNIQIQPNDSLATADNQHKEVIKESLFYSLFGDTYSESMGQTIISFGLTGDKFYTENAYTKWTISMGLGGVPKESISSLVIIIICVGVGVPLSIFILSGVYFGVKKLKKKPEDESSLINAEE